MLRKAAGPVEGEGEMRRCGTESRVEYEAVEIRALSLSLFSDLRLARVHTSNAVQYNSAE